MGDYECIHDYGARVKYSDNRQSIMKCMNASLVSGKPVLIPDGIFQTLAEPSKVWSLYLPGPVSMVGESEKAFLWSSAPQLIRADSKNNVTLKDFSIAGNYKTSLYGIVHAGISTNWNVSGINANDFLDTGVYSNGFMKASKFSKISVNHCGNFGAHWHNEGKVAFDGLTLEDIKCLRFEGKSNIPHGVYLKVGKNAILHNVEAGMCSGPYENHSGIELDDVDTALLDGCVGHHCKDGVAISRYGTKPTATGCKNITLRNSGGHDNKRYDIFEYLVNINIVRETSCYGTYGKYLG